MTVRDMPAVARARDLMPVVLGGPCPRIGQIGDLMGVLHAQVSGTGQVLAARAGAFFCG